MRSLALAAALAAFPAAAQHAHHGPSPYSGLEVRPIKALSEQQVADLKAGRGMGLALAAELNGYPGPMHVLELADRLELTPEQRSRTEALFTAMRTEAIGLGEEVVRREAELNRLFVERTVDLTGLHAAVSEIGLRQAGLRLIHLKYHLAMMDVLSPAQVAEYRVLRGYSPK
jgi:Spy/CpxP family protein refolding chaperone